MPLRGTSYRWWFRSCTSGSPNFARSGTVKSSFAFKRSSRFPYFTTNCRPPPRGGQFFSLYHRRRRSSPPRSLLPRIVKPITAINISAAKAVVDTDLIIAPPSIGNLTKIINRRRTTTRRTTTTTTTATSTTTTTRTSLKTPITTSKTKTTTATARTKARETKRIERTRRIGKRYNNSFYLFLFGINRTASGSIDRNTTSISRTRKWRRTKTRTRRRTSIGAIATPPVRSPSAS